MKSLILVFMCFLLSGCVTMSPCIEQRVVTKYKYIVIDIPDNMTSIPEKVKDIDVLSDLIRSRISKAKIHNDLDKIVVIQEVEREQTQEEYRKNIKKIAMKKNY